MDTKAYVADVLRREGIEYFFCFPSSPLIKAAKRVGIQPIICRQERVGGNIADGYSRTTNGDTVGVFLSQYGPGAENAYPALATAYADSTPLLYLPWGYDRDRAQVPPHFRTAENVKPITKRSEYLTAVDHVPDTFHRAFAALKNGRPRPVAVEIPDDVLHSTVPKTEGATDRPSPKRHRAAGDPQAIETAVSALLAAERPVIHAGHGVLYAEATSELVELAELLEIPVMTTLLGKSAFPEDHDLSMGTGARVVTGPVRHFLPDADLVFGIGCSFTRHNMSVDIPEAPTIIHATNDESDIDKMYDAEYPILGDAKLVLQQMIEEAGRQLENDGGRETGLAAENVAVRDEFLEEWMPKLTDDDTPLTPFHIIWTFMDVVDPATAIVTHDSGSPRDQLTPFYQATEPRSYLGWGRSHSLGTGLGLIMGAKLARPEKFCVNFMGDAAFGMVGLDFETAVRHEIPITTVVFNNNSMAAYEDRLGEERYLGGNYADLARSLGGRARRITDPEEIAPAFEEARSITEQDTEPVLLEFMTREEIAQNDLKGL